jgi:hypothetical protein
MGVYPKPLGIGAGDVTVTARGVANGGTITGAVEEINAAKHEVVLTLEGDGTTSPILTGFSAFAAGAARSGTDTVVLDTSEHADKVAVIDVRPTFEKDGRRTTAEVELRVINGALIVNAPDDGPNVYPGLEVGNNYNFMHDRLGDVLVHGSEIIKKGLFQTTVATDVRGSDLQSMVAAWGNPNSRQLYTVSDFWGMVDGFLIRRRPVGDGLMLGAWLRILLRLRGFTLAEMAGISPTMGPRLPKALGDNPPAVRPDYEADLGEELRRTMELFGRGRILSCRGGVWSAGFPSTEIKAVFQRGGNIATASRADGIYRIFDGADLPRDYGESFNTFTVAGGEDASGRRIVRTWQIKESISNPNSPYFIGDVRAYQTVDAPNLRTDAQVRAAVRSLAASKGKPGIFMEWESWWIDDLYPGDRIQNCGQEWELERIADASAARDRMHMVARKVAPPAGGVWL